MKVKFGVLIGCVLCALSVACLGFLSRLEKSKDSWTPGDIYTQVGGSSFSTVSSGASSSDGVLVAMRGLSRISRRVSAPAISYAPSASMSSVGAGVGSTCPSLQGGAGVGSVYTTSSAQYRSFGGGGNVGVSVSGGSVQSSSSVPAPSVSMNVSMPSASVYTLASQNSNVNIPVVSGDAAIASVMSSSAYTSSYSGVGVGGGTSRGVSRGIGGRHEAPGYNDGGWLNWLVLNDYGTYDAESGTWMLDQYALYSAWVDYCASWNATMGPMPTWDEWLAWFMKSEDSRYEWTDGDSSKYYQFLPVGGFWPLMLFVLLYCVVVSLKLRKSRFLGKL